MVDLQDKARYCEMKRPEEKVLLSLLAKRYPNDFPVLRSNNEHNKYGIDTIVRTNSMKEPMPCDIKKEGTPFYFINKSVRETCSKLNSDNERAERIRAFMDRKVLPYYKKLQDIPKLTKYWDFMAINPDPMMRYRDMYERSGLLLWWDLNHRKHYLRDDEKFERFERMMGKPQEMHGAVWGLSNKGFWRMVNDQPLFQFYDNRRSDDGLPSNPDDPLRDTKGNNSCAYYIDVTKITQYGGRKWDLPFPSPDDKVWSSL